MRLNVKTKILLILLVACLSVTLAGGLGLNGMRQGNNIVEALYAENLTNISQLSQIMSLMQDNRVQLLLALQHNPANPEIVKLHDHALEKHTDQVPKNIAEITEIWKRYMNTRLVDEEKRLADDFATKRAQFVTEGLLPVLAAVQGGDYATAGTLTITKINPLFKEATDAAQKLYDHEQLQAKQSHEAAISQMRTVMIEVTVAIVVSILFSVLLGLLILRSIASASASLIRVSGAMASGDLSQRVHLTTGDEFAVIGEAFDTMADSFSDALRKVAESSGQVATAATQVNATAERIATGAESMASQAEGTATAGEEMSATSADIARNCLLAAEGAKKASSSAQEGAHVVEATIAVMGEIASQVQQSARTVASLGERSDQIGAIIGTIEDIADQTNLLALNAAIEAARAGEQGRGFAVVADEVRALAERTTRATREIGEMIKAIQGETKGAVDAMEQGVAKVESGTMEAAKSGQALREILAQINDVTQQVDQIATAAEEQTATTGEISSNIQQMSGVVQETASGAHESASAASTLNQNALELQRLVGQFRLS